MASNVRSYISLHKDSESIQVAEIDISKHFSRVGTKFGFATNLPFQSVRRGVET